MNEQQNVALIKDMYAAFARGDVQAILSKLTENVEWTMQGPDAIPYAGTKTGPAEVSEFFQSLASTQADVKLTVDDFIAQSDKVASTGRYSCTVKRTGKRIDCAVAHIFTIDNGRVTRLLDFVDTAQMADAYTGGSAAAGE